MAASEASGASAWNGSGLWRKKTRTLLAVLLLDLLQRGDHAAAERALEVGERDDVHLRVRRPLGRALERDADAVDAVTGARVSLAAADGVLADALAVPPLSFTTSSADAVATPQHHHQQS